MAQLKVRVAAAAVAVALTTALAYNNWWTGHHQSAASSQYALDISPTGDVHTHDPALVVGAGDDPWYVFSTGDIKEGLGSPQIRRSLDQGKTWAYLGTVWDAASRPKWLSETIPGVTNLWAPEVYHRNGIYYLYYAASTFGTNRSAIGLATNTTLDPSDPAYTWVDGGKVWESTPGDDNYNAIDPAIIEDESGVGWLAFGSFWNGIQMVKLSWPSGLAADVTQEPVVVASRISQPRAVEAPSIVHRGAWYYLFVSRDMCCRGVDSTYNIAVGRSLAPTGPYLDRTGKDLASGGGTPVLAGEGNLIGPGGQTIVGDLLAFHYYDGAAGGDFALGLRKLAWDDEQWPIATTKAEVMADQP